MSCTMKTASMIRAPMKAGQTTSSSKPVAARCIKAAFKGNTAVFSTKPTQRVAQRMIVKTKAASVAQSYAAGLCELAKDTNSLEATNTDLETLMTIMTDDVRDYIFNPTLDADKRKKIIQDIGKEASFSAATVSFLCLLIDKRRIGSLEAIITEFQALYCAATDTEVATVTSAFKLENEQQFLIAKSLQEKTGAKNVKLKPIVDPELIGGFVLNYGPSGTNEIDMSLKGKLDKLAASLDA